MRKNDKESLLNYENSIKKSKELSMSKLNHGLTLNQMQLLAYAIYSTQKNGKTEFHKASFEKKFGIEKYQTVHAKQDVQKLLGLQFSIEDLDNNYFEYWNVFGSIKYKDGLFTFRWNEEFVPHILELKDKWYITTDLSITANFKSSFSWILYDFLKAHYGNWYKPITKEVFMRLFGVENIKSYSNNTGLLKKKVLDVAIAEINKFTEFEVWYKDIKEGRAITGFEIHWSSGETEAAATKKQIKELKAIVEIVFDDVFKYVNLKNDPMRERAIVLVKEIESYREFTMEPICITSKYANSLLQKASMILRELERMVETDQKNTTSNTSSFYNWLENRE